MLSILPITERLSRLLNSPSIKRRIKTSYVIIIAFMLIPSVSSIANMLLQTIRYDRIITNVSKTNRLNQIVKTEVSNEIWDIVAGNKKFADGEQYTIIQTINTSLEEIKSTTTDVKNRQMLEVAGRAVGTLQNYVDRIGQQIEAQYPVIENEKMLDELRGVSALISDILQDFIVLEIESAAMTNEAIKKTTWKVAILQLVIVFFVTLFAFFAQRSVSNSINKPIEELEKLSNRIAAGDLLARATIPNVKELDNLTYNLNTMALKIQELISANIREQQNQQKSEMKALQAQITPHFLYNTLDTIIWLAKARRYDQVIAITRSFSSFFRISLSRGKDWIAVEEELEHVRSYLVIQKIRYRDILDYEIDCDSDIAKSRILKLLLQPLVENALYHGIKNKRGLGLISVKGWKENGYLCFSVEDNGIGMSAEHLAHIRNQIDREHDPETLSDVYGLYNVNKRLELYHGPGSQLDITSQHTIGTKVSFKIPEVIYSD